MNYTPLDWYWLADDGRVFASARNVVVDKATKVTPRDLAYVAGLVSAREDMASIARIAAVDGSTPKAWFDAALGVAS